MSKGKRYRSALIAGGAVLGVGLIAGTSVAGARLADATSASGTAPATKHALGDNPDSSSTDSTANGPTSGGASDSGASDSDGTNSGSAANGGAAEELDLDEQIDLASRFFDKGYDYEDAQRLAELWKLPSPWDAKVTAGQKIEAGEPLPFKP
jgi:hypothetical protein